MRRCRALLAMVLAALPVAVPRGSTAAEADDARLQRLSYWQESPLDLRRADAADIALLPGLDPDLAEGVVGLREAGALHRLEDLLRVPGLGPAELDALQPYVRLGGAAPAAGAELDLAVQRRRSDGPRWRQATHAVAGGIDLEFVILRSPRPVRRGAARLALGDRVTLSGGDLVLSGPAEVFAALDSRSRVAPAARPRAAQVRARTDSGEQPGWTGVALGQDGRGFAFVGRGPAGRTAGGLALGGRHEGLRFGLALRAGDGLSAAGGFVSHGAGRAVSWVEFLAEPRARAGRFGVRLAGQGWRFGFDGSAADGAMSRGSDPVTGDRLDRAHEVLQVHGRLRQADWSAGFLAREMRRGPEPRVSRVATLDLDLVWRPRSRPGPERLDLALRAAPARRLTLVAHFRSGSAFLRARFSRESDGEESAEIFGVDLERTLPAGRVILAAATVDGDGSRVWTVRRPGTGIYPVWLRPAESLGASGVELQGARLRMGVWAWIRGGGSRAPETGLGLTCGLRAGRLVRRLH